MIAGFTHEYELVLPMNELVSPMSISNDLWVSPKEYELVSPMNELVSPENGRSQQ